MCSFRWSARLGVLAFVFAACRDDAPEIESTTTAANDASSDTGAPEADACEAACADLSIEAGATLCHACRCKVAFDDWMPEADEVQCANAVPIETYHAELSGSETVLEPSPIQAVTCANPSLLTGSCRPGSRLGRLQHDDVTIQWICRDPYLDVDGTVIFHDVAAIGHNVRTGATCFWDDTDDVTHEDDLPLLDFEVASEDERARHLEVFDPVDNDVCTRCHDHDPFIYTPYLESTGWLSLAMGKGPYSTVTFDRDPAPVDATHLVSEAAAPCLTCHRLGSNETCARFAADAMGVEKNEHYESEVRDAMEPGSPHWKLAHWMPSEQTPIADYETWLATFADARDHILACCEAPGEDVGDCRWEAVPAE